MEFQPKIRLKRRPPVDRNFFPYETTDVPEENRISATFTGLTVEVYDPKDMEFLHKNGCFGKSSLARTAPSSDQESIPETPPEALILDLEEAFFLKKSLEVLKIFDLKGNELSDMETFMEFSKIKKRFLLYFVLYQHLKSNVWIVKSGIKFGADIFALQIRSRIRSCILLCIFDEWIRHGLEVHSRCSKKCRNVRKECFVSRSYASRKL